LEVILKLAKGWLDFILENFRTPLPIIIAQSLIITIPNKNK